jgi:hypothetical protein
MIEPGQNIVVRIDNTRWPARVIKINTNGSIKVEYCANHVSTVLPSEVVAHAHPYTNMPLDHPIRHYETAKAYRYVFYGEDPSDHTWKTDRKSYFIVTWNLCEDGSYNCLVVENDETCKLYNVPGIHRPVLTDTFCEVHAQRPEKLIANEQFALAIRSVDHTYKKPIYILDTGGTTEVLQSLGADKSRVVVVNPDPTLDVDVAHEVMTMHEFINCRFYQANYKCGHVGLDLCCLFDEVKSRPSIGIKMYKPKLIVRPTLPKQDLASLLECVLTNDSILWVTVSTRGVQDGHLQHHVIESYLEEIGAPMGFKFKMLHNARYNKIAYAIFHVTYSHALPQLSDIVEVPGKRKSMAREFLTYPVPQKKPQKSNSTKVDAAEGLVNSP